MRIIFFVCVSLIVYRPCNESQLYFGVDHSISLDREEHQSGRQSGRQDHHHHHHRKTRRIATMDSGNESSIEFHVRNSWRGFDKRTKAHRKDED